MQPLTRIAYLLFGALLPLAAHAQPRPPLDAGNPSGGQPPGGNPSGANPGLTNPLKDIDTLDEFLGAILDGIIYLGTIVLIMMLVYVGLKFVLARGNPEEISSARNALIWTVIGGLILLGAKSIQLMITGTVNSLR